MNNEMNTQEPKVRKSKKFTLNTIVDYVVKFLPIITIVFLALAVISFFYEGLMGIIACFNGGWVNIIRSLFDGLGNGVESFAKYLFYAVISGCFSKILNRK